MGFLELFKWSLDMGIIIIGEFRNEKRNHGFVRIRKKSYRNDMTLFVTWRLREDF